MTPQDTITLLLNSNIQNCGYLSAAAIRVTF